MSSPEKNESSRINSENGVLCVAVVVVCVVVACEEKDDFLFCDFDNDDSWSIFIFLI